MASYHRMVILSIHKQITKSVPRWQCWMFIRLIEVYVNERKRKRNIQNGDKMPSVHKRDKLWWFMLKTSAPSLSHREYLENHTWNFVARYRMPLVKHPYQLIQKTKWKKISPVPHSIDKSIVKFHSKHPKKNIQTRRWL